jgi:hypothetical protein
MAVSRHPSNLIDLRANPLGSSFGSGISHRHLTLPSPPVYLFRFLAVSNVGTATSLREALVVAQEQDKAAHHRIPVHAYTGIPHILHQLEANYAILYSTLF